jgi:hypothetical protein
MEDSTCKLQLYEKRPLIYIEQLLKSDLHLAFRNVLKIKVTLSITSYIPTLDGFTVRAKNRVNTSYIRCNTIAKKHTHIVSGD